MNCVQRLGITVDEDGVPKPPAPRPSASKAKSRRQSAANAASPMTYNEAVLDRPGSVDISDMEPSHFEFVEPLDPVSMPPMDHTLPHGHTSQSSAGVSGINNYSASPHPYMGYYGQTLAPQDYHYAASSPVYDFAAGSPATNNNATPSYAGLNDLGAWRPVKLAERLNGANGIFSPGTPVPASPLDLLAMVSPEPSSIALNQAPLRENGEIHGEDFSTISDSAPAYEPMARHAPVATKSFHSPSSDSSYADLISKIPYPVLAATLFPPRFTPAPINPLTTLYPTLPPSLLPPWPVTSYLISQFVEFDHVRIVVLHPPTFYDEVVTGQADPNLLLAIMWSGIRMADPGVGRAKARQCGGQWEHVFAADGRWAQELQEECLRRSFSEWEVLKQAPDLDVTNPDPVLLSRLTNMLSFIYIVRVCCTVIGASLLKVTRICNALVPKLKTGELPIDLAPYDYMDLPTLVRRELRVRRHLLVSLADTTFADTHGILPELMGDPASFELDSTGSYKQKWANMRLGIGPGVLFDALPPASTTPEVWAGIVETVHSLPHPLAPHKTIEVSVLPVISNFFSPIFGEVFTHLSKPINDPHRKYISQVIGRGCLRNGYIWMQLALSDIWARFVRIKLYYVSRGWRLHAPPLGDSREEKEGRKMREELMSGIGEFFAELPPEIAKLVEQADGKGLRTACEREYGRTWRSCL